MNKIPHNKLTQEDFMSRVMHFNTELDFSRSEYVSNNTKVVIVCKTHGETMQYPHLLFKGAGCGQCGNARAGLKRMAIAKEKYFRECKIIHNNFYDYSKSEYLGAHKKLRIICPLHGEFTCSANNHKKGSGCAICGRMKTEASINFGGKGVICETTLGRGDHSNIKLYVFKITSDNEDFYKVGLSNNPLKRSYGIRSDSNKIYKVEILHIVENNSDTLFKLEQSIVGSLEKYSPNIKFGGYTECISINPIPILQAKISELS